MLVFVLRRTEHVMITFNSSLLRSLDLGFGYELSRIFPQTKYTISQTMYKSSIQLIPNISIQN